MSKYRVDQFMELQEAVERMQQAWNEQPIAKTPVRTKETLEPTRPQQLADPSAVQQKFAKALDKNLQVGAMHPQFAKAVGRSHDGQNKVVAPLVKSEPRADEWLFPGIRTPQRRRLAKGKKLKKSRRKSVLRDVDEEANEREEIFEEGVDYVEHQARPAYEHPMTHGRDGAEPSEYYFEDEETEPSGGRGPRADRVSDTEVTKVTPRRRQTSAEEEEAALSPDVTHPDFEYKPGETAYDDWVRQHSEGAKVVKGEGSTCVDRDKTKTQVIRKKGPR